MNRKNITKIVAVALTVSAFSAIAPTTLPFNLGTKAAYASSDNEGIKDIKSSKGTMYKKSDYSSKTSYKDSIDKYYIKLSESTSKFKITATAKSDYTVEVVDKDDDDEDINKEDISIKKGKTKTLYVISKDKDGKEQSKVTIKVKRADDDDDDDDEDGAEIFYVR